MTAEHRTTCAQASLEGFSLTCSCGWTHTARFARMIHRDISRRRMAEEQAAHVKHMALVHEAKTHGFTNCGRLCIYDRKAMESAQSATGGAE